MIFCSGRLLSAILPIVISSFFLAPGSLWAADLPDMGASSPPLAAPMVSGVANLIPVPLIRQNTGSTCGVSALESIFAYYGQDFRADKLAKALKTTPENGTDYRNIVRVAARNRYNVQTYNPMTIDQLKAYIDARTPVLLTIQAWPEKPVDWSRDWKDGHYVVAIGYDDDNFYFMDPATIGNYTYIPADEFLARWHDEDQRKKKLINFGIVIGGKEPVYDPQQIKPLD
jgi:predicted double-glycine peptidase